MQLFINIRSLLLSFCMLTFYVHTNAFTLTTTPRCIGISTMPVTSRISLFGSRQCMDNLNHDIETATGCDEKALTRTGIQLLKTMMIASVIAFGSTFTTDVASVSAATNDHMNGVTDASPSFLLAKGAYVPESGYDSLDFSMPSYRVEADIAEPIKINDLLGGSTSATDNTGAKKASSPSSPNRAEKGAQAVAQAKAKKEAAKAEALAKQQALKEKATVQASD